MFLFVLGVVYRLLDFIQLIDSTARAKKHTWTQLIAVTSSSIKWAPTDPKFRLDSHALNEDAD